MMALKFSIVVLSAFIFLQVLISESQATAIRRAAPADEKNASQTIDDAIQSLKTGFNDLVKTVQGNELLQNVTQTLQQFGESMQQKGKELVSKIQSDGSTKQ